MQAGDEGVKDGEEIIYDYGFDPNEATNESESSSEDERVSRKRRKGNNTSYYALVALIQKNDCYNVCVGPQKDKNVAVEDKQSSATSKNTPMNNNRQRRKAVVPEEAVVPAAVKGNNTSYYVLVALIQQYDCYIVFVGPQKDKKVAVENKQSSATSKDPMDNAIVEETALVVVVKATANNNRTRRKTAAVKGNNNSYYSSVALIQKYDCYNVCVGPQEDKQSCATSAIPTVAAASNSLYYSSSEDEILRRTAKRRSLSPVAADSIPTVVSTNSTAIVKDNAKDAIHEEHDGNTSKLYAFAVVMLI